MSSSSSDTRHRAPRVLRGGASSSSTATDVLGLDLARDGLSRFDPSRIEVAVAEGHAAGFAAGQEAGLAEARAAHAALAASYHERLAAVLQAAESAVADALSTAAAVAEATAGATVDAAFTVAEAIVGRELVLAEEPGRDAVARALTVAPDGIDLTLRLNPDDAAALVTDALPPGRAVNVLPDPAIAAGDCVAEAGWTRIDARLGSALDRVRAVLGERA